MKKRKDIVGKASVALRSFFAKSLVSKRTVFLVFALFFVFGALVVPDYGMSTDEPQERHTSLVNYVHVMGGIMRGSEHESVRAIAQGVAELPAYEDRYYGAALQCITVAIEHLFNFQLQSREIFLIRHAFVFINYFLASICFYLIIKRRFGNSCMPLLGLLAFILYPRFFGEAFYNIKDLLFFSWVVISGYFTLRWLEGRKTRYYFFAAAALAAAINTRVLGLSILLLACVFAAVLAILKKDTFWRAAGRPLALFALTMVFWTIITPFLWLNPLKNMAATFDFFLNVVEWDGAHFYMGEMISRHVPWHYIPVWMGITIPLPYIAMFFAGIAAICAGSCKSIKQALINKGESNKTERKKTKKAPLKVVNAISGETELVYDLFMLALFVFTLLGFIVLGISMYEGWRHAYGIYFPFIYIAVYGLGASAAFIRNKGILLRRIGGASVAAVFIFLAGWICLNHPYEYVYFNGIGSMVAERYFALDYWQVSHMDLIRRALSNDSGGLLRFSYSNALYNAANMLTEAEQNRFLWEENPEFAHYYIQDTRMPYSARIIPEGFEEYASIKAGGMTISSLYKSKSPPRTELDGSAWEHIELTETNMSGSELGFMHDRIPNTRWTSGRIQNPGDYILFKFDRPVDYDFILMQFGYSPEDYPRELHILLSEDAKSWTEIHYTEFADGWRFEEKPAPYSFIVFENRALAPNNWWSIHELHFGHALGSAEK